MAMTTGYLDMIANHATTILTHIGLVDDLGAELVSASYAREAVTWVAASGDGVIRPNANLVFDLTAGDVVAGWRAFTALTAGTNHGGAALTEVTFGNDGTYTLLAASTAIDHDAV